MIKEYNNTLGSVEFKANKLSKRITARYRDGRFKISYPAWMKLPDVEKVLEKMSPDLVKLKNKSPEKQLLSPESNIKTYSFNVRIIANGAKFYLSKKDNTLYIVCPENSDFNDTELQARIKAGIETLLRKEAKRLFPDWIEQLANKNQFHYNSLKINNSKSRWGSCSVQRNINLSFYCLLLPHHLIELIILHELCHTIEMNHSDRFWRLLDQVTNGKAKELTIELRNYKTGI